MAEWSEYRRVKPCALGEHYALKISPHGNSNQCVFHDAHKKLKAKKADEKKAKKAAASKMGKPPASIGKSNPSMLSTPISVEVKLNKDMSVPVGVPPMPTPSKPTPTLADTLLTKLDAAGSAPMLDEWSNLKKKMDEKFPPKKPGDFITFDSETTKPSFKVLEPADTFHYFHQKDSSVPCAASVKGVVCPSCDASQEAKALKPVTAGPKPSSTVETLKPVASGVQPPLNPGLMKEVGKEFNKKLAEEIVSVQPMNGKTWTDLLKAVNTVTPEKLDQPVIVASQKHPSTLKGSGDPWPEHLAEKGANDIANAVDKEILNDLLKNSIPVPTDTIKKIVFENLDYECIRKVSKGLSVWRSLSDPDRVVLSNSEDPGKDAKHYGYLVLDRSRPIEMYTNVANTNSVKIPVVQEAGDFVEFKADATCFEAAETALFLAARFGMRIKAGDAGEFSVIAIKPKKVPVEAAKTSEVPLTF